MKGSYLGPDFSQDEIENELLSLNAVYKKVNYDEIINFTAKAISKEKR